MTIKQTGGIFGRSPTFADVEITGQLQADSGQFDGNVNIDGTVTADGLTLQTSEDVISWSNGNGIVQAPSSLYLRSSGTGNVLIQSNSNAIAKFENGGDISFYEDTGTTPKMVWSASAESLGIGTSSPDGNLTVGSTTTSGDISIRIKGDATSRGFLMFGDAGGAQLGDIMYDHSTDHMRFRVNNAERMRIDSSGNVGIGTSSLSERLHVYKLNGAVFRLSGGTASDWQWVAATTSGGYTPGDSLALYESTSGSTGYRITIKSGGNVGIGTTSPGTELDVNGDITADGIYLGGTGAANLLDDYEEGTHEVTVTPSISGTVTLGSAYDDVAYTKVGRLVNVTGGLDVTSISSPSGYLIVSLPFQVATGSQASRASAAITVYNTTGANTSDFTTLLVSGESAMRIYLGDATSLQNDSAEAMTSTSRIVFSVTYVTN